MFVFVERYVVLCSVVFFFFFFKQKTAYEMRISDWSSDVCSSDLKARQRLAVPLIGAEDRPPCQEIVGAERARPADRLGRQERQSERDGRDEEEVVEQGGDHRRQHVAEQDGVDPDRKIGKASWRERVVQYVEIAVVAVTLKTKKKRQYINQTK